MPSYYLTFRCDNCGEAAIAPIIGLSSRKQDQLFASDAKYDATCANGHRSTYFCSELIRVHRKLSPMERQTEPELLGDERFTDIP